MTRTGFLALAAMIQARGEGGKRVGGSAWGGSEGKRVGVGRAAGRRFRRAASLPLVSELGRQAREELFRGLMTQISACSIIFTI